jgi:hypothetical protein
VFPARYELNSYIVFRKRLDSIRLKVGLRPEDLKLNVLLKSKRNATKDLSCDLSNTRSTCVPEVRIKEDELRREPGTRAMLHNILNSKPERERLVLRPGRDGKVILTEYKRKSYVFL